MRHVFLLLLAACGSADTPAPVEAPPTDEVDVTPDAPAEVTAEGMTLEREKGGAIVLVDASGARRTLAEHSTISLAHSEDGTRAAWVALPEGGPMGVLTVLDLAPGADPRALARGAVDRVALSPDGAHVAYVRGGVYPRMEIVAVDGGEPRVLTNEDLVRTPGKAPEGFVPPPHEGPPRFDGDRLVWEAPDGTHEVPWR